MLLGGHGSRHAGRARTPSRARSPPRGTEGGPGERICRSFRDRSWAREHTRSRVLHARSRVLHAHTASLCAHTRSCTGTSRQEAHAQLPPGRTHHAWPHALDSHPCVTYVRDFFLQRWRQRTPSGLRAGRRGCRELAGCHVFSSHRVSPGQENTACSVLMETPL